MDRPLVSCVIVNFKSAQLLPACLESLSRAFPQEKSLEVIVANNDESEKEELESLQFEKKSFLLMHVPNNPGFGAANNQATRKARGKYLFFLNPDARLVGENLSQAIDFLESHPSHILGCKLVDNKGRIQSWGNGSEVTLWDILRNNIGFPRSKQVWGNIHATPVDWVSGAAFLLSHDFFTTLNGFDEEFFLYFEDVDLCQRARARGGKVLYFPHVSVEHSSGQSASSKRTQKQHFYASQDRYFKKHRPSWEGVAVTLLRRLTHFY